MKPVYFIIILLSLISYEIVDTKILKPDLFTRIEIQNSILQGQMDYPYQYRILKPASGYALQKILKLFVDKTYRAHLYAYRIITFVVFLLIYCLLYLYLKMFFSDIACMIGMLLLQVVIPLSMTSVWQEGDFYNLLFFLIGFILMFKSKDYYLPLVFGIGLLNREQIIFLMVFYIAYLISQNKLRTKKSILTIVFSVIACLIVFFALRWKYGYKYTEVNYNAIRNIENISYIIELWICQALIFILLSFKAFKRSYSFFKLGFIALGFYFTLYFFYGYMAEFAKFLPAYLILIPMSLQILTGESTLKKEEIPAQTV